MSDDSGTGPAQPEAELDRDAGGLQTPEHDEALDKLLKGVRYGKDETLPADWKPPWDEDIEWDEIAE